MKNWKLNILSLFILIYSAPLLAQNYTQTVKGKVVDEDTEMPLIGAIVVMEDANSNAVAATDVDGIYILRSVPIGRHSFKISYIGYEDAYLKQVLVESG